MTRATSLPSALHVAAALAACAVALAAAACGPSVDDAAVTYHRDVAPIVQAQCVSCHQQGGIAPFALTTYDEVVANKDLIKFSVEARTMPPYTLDNSGTCQTFTDARWLTDDEIATIGAWVDAGTPEGTVTTDAQALSTDEHLGDDATFVEMAETYVPTPSSEHPNDDYRCFFVDPELANDAWVTGLEILPGEPSIVHHMLLFSLLSDQAEADAQALDDAEEGQGWTCFSDAGVDDINLVAGWAPGKSVVRYPEGTGLFAPAHRKLVMQIHYNLTAGQLPDQTALKIQFAPTATEAALLPIADDNWTLQPGQESVKYSFSTPLAGLPSDVNLWGVFPHMHTLGKTMHFERRPIGDTDGSDAECLADVPKWDFHWQQLAFYPQPITLSGSDRIDLTCEWDTRGRTAPVTWGEGTQDEMCLIFVYITRADGGSILELLQ